MFWIYDGGTNCCYPQLHHYLCSWSIMWTLTGRPSYCQYLYEMYSDHRLTLVRCLKNIDWNTWKMTAFFNFIRFSILLIHGNVGGFLYQCDKHSCRHQWTWGWSIIDYRSFYHCIQFYRNVSRSKQSTRAWILFTHYAAIFRYIVGSLDV